MTATINAYSLTADATAVTPSTGVASSSRVTPFMAFRLTRGQMAVPANIFTLAQRCVR
jgi:hypothetical protein